MKPRVQGLDQVRADKIAAMQVKIIEGLNSGISPYSISEIFDMARAEHASRVQSDKKSPI
ncbi:hypothetical protein ABAC460_20290 [Asticcacaulis sp. AC460]|uniref:hypothetical protein n=1 Tax=Asticcacaulis sp. AC460 TaxID=1282360 RepID=UPI0003C3CA8C|nr:hypothetical protein [Asticcacaulis sp. AC460]ESQ87366.1 hypothetical protein ABAC460_20290 [Asticcacaulis sp. AC460]